jgi:excisionase family DNA binding protein
MQGKIGLAIAEVVELLPLGRTRLYEEIAAGRLRAHKLGRRTIIFPEDLDDFLKSLPRLGVD